MTYQSPKAQNRSKPSSQRNSRFGILVQELRDQKRWTQKQLVQRSRTIASITPITLKQLRDIEQGLVGLASLLDHLETLSKVLELSQEQLPAFYAVAGFSFPYHNVERQQRIANWLIEGKPLPNIFPMEYKTETIRWLVNYRELHSKEQRSIIDTGVRAFELIVRDGLATTEVQQITGETRDFLRAAVKSALRSRTLQITDVRQNQMLESRLQNLWPEATIIVADTPDYDSELIRAELIAWLAAQSALNRVRNEKAIGIGPGYTMSRFAALSQPSSHKFKGTKWVPLAQLNAISTHHTSANQVAGIMARQHPGSEAYYFPYMNGNISDYALARFNEIIDLSSEMTEVFMSTTNIGKEADDPDRLFTADGITEKAWVAYDLLGNQHARFACQILGIFLDRQTVPIPLTEKAVDPTTGISFDMQPEYKEMILGILRDVIRIRDGRVWILAAGRYKSRGILTALENGICNSIVIDSQIAEQLATWKLSDESDQQLPLFE